MKTKRRKAKNQAADKSQAARKEVAEELTILRPDAGGVDCGAEEHYASVPPDRVPAGQAAVRCFSAFTEGLDALVVCVLLTPSGGLRPFLVNLVRGTRTQRWW
jgi:hypothetical protein